MLQVNFIRNNKEEVIKRLAVKNYKDTSFIDKVLELDDERKKRQFEFDELQSRINSASKEIGKLIGTGKKNEAEEKKTEVNNLKSSLHPVNERLIITEKELRDALIKLPNLPHASVPNGKTPEDNEIVREGGQQTFFKKQITTLGACKKI